MSEQTGSPAGPAPGAYGMNQNDFPPKMGMGARLLNIFVEPSSVFKNIYYHSDWLTPLLFMGVLAMVSAFLVSEYNAEAQRQWGEVVNQAVGRTVQAGGGAGAGIAREFTKYVGIVLAPVGIMFGWLFGAVLVFVLGSFMLDKVDFKKLYSILATASMPAAFTGLINAVYKMNQTPVVESYKDYLDSMTPWTLSVSRFFPIEGNIGIMAASFDLFAIWSLWLMVVGLVYGLRNKVSASIWVVILYAVISAAIQIGLMSLGYMFLPKGLKE